MDTVSLKRRIERSRERLSLDYPGWGAAGEQVPEELAGTDKSFLECIACFEIWRRLGYKADQIFFQVGGKLLRPPGYQVCLVLLLRDGRGHEKNRFTFIAGSYDAKPDVIEAEWLRVAGLVKGLREETLAAIYNGASCKKAGASMLKAMLEKGFTFVKDKN